LNKNELTIYNGDDSKFFIAPFIKLQPTNEDDEYWDSYNTSNQVEIGCEHVIKIIGQ
jgi:hypothetical protein